MSFINTKDDVDFALKKATELGLITCSQNAIFKETINKIVNYIDAKKT